MSSESEIEGSDQLIYEQMMFHKLFALNWSGFVSHFDRSLLIDQINGEVFFVSDGTKHYTTSLNRLKQFFSISNIDPDELANTLALKELAEGKRIIQQQIQSNIQKQVLPTCEEVIALDDELLKEFEYQ